MNPPTLKEISDFSGVPVEDIRAAVYREDPDLLSLAEIAGKTGAKNEWPIRVAVWSDPSLKAQLVQVGKYKKLPKGVAAQKWKLDIGGGVRALQSRTNQTVSAH